MRPAIRQTKATRETVRSLSARSTWCWECGSLVAPSFRWDWELSLSFPVCEMGPASLPALTLPDPFCVWIWRHHLQILPPALAAALTRGHQHSGYRRSFSP